MFFPTNVRWKNRNPCEILLPAGFHSNFHREIKDSVNSGPRVGICENGLFLFHGFFVADWIGDDFRKKYWNISHKIFRMIRFVVGKYFLLSPFMAHTHWHTFKKTHLPAGIQIWCSDVWKTREGVDSDTGRKWQIGLYRNPLLKM